MKILLSTGYTENYWQDWPFARMMGGSEQIVTELATEFAALGHLVKVRLPYKASPRVFKKVLWFGIDEIPQPSDLNLCFDQYDDFDPTDNRVLVVNRSTPPRHDDFTTEIFLSDTHRRYLGRPNHPYIGGGVRMSDYKGRSLRIKDRVIYTSSPDRGLVHAAKIARGRDFVATYKPVALFPGFPKSVELDRSSLIGLQRTAMALIHPCDPIAPSEFFCMAVLECMAARTPALISDADALPELWGDVCRVLPRPIDYAEWSDALDNLPPVEPAYRKAQDYDWPKVAQRYLKVALDVPTVQHHKARDC